MGMRASTFCLSHSAKPEEVRGVGGAPEDLLNFRG